MIWIEIYRTYFEKGRRAMAVSIKGKTKASLLSAENSARERHDSTGGSLRTGDERYGEPYTTRKCQTTFTAKRFLIVLLLILF